MAHSRPRRVVWSLAALALAGMLGGCVVYPDYPAYRYPAPYYGGPYVGVGVGGGWHGGHRRGW